MSSNLILPFAAAWFSSVFALVGILRKRHSIAGWCFSAGMVTFAVESVLGAVSLHVSLPSQIVFWQTLVLITKSFQPGIWLCFSLTYSRGNYREFLAGSRFLLVAAFLVPIGLSLGFRTELLQALPDAEPVFGWWLSFGGAAKALNLLLLIGTVLILMNLEKTFRSTVGTMQWRIKFLVLGLGVVFGARIYTQSQALLFSASNLALTGIETGALLVGCTLMSIAYLRGGFSEVDVYPSRAVLQTSVTVILAGGYLFVIGVLAKIVAHFGGAGSFGFQAFLVLLGIVALAVLLLSKRLRQNIQGFVSRHFKRPQHDFRKIWTDFTQCMSNMLDQTGLCVAAANLISETFNVLSVTIWFFDEQKEQLVFAASTSQLTSTVGDFDPNSPDANLSLAGLVRPSQPFDLETAKEDWGGPLKQISSTQFRKGGNRICVPLRSGERLLGVAILADRVSGVPYTVEELDLLKCIGDQVAASLLNLRLTNEIMRSKELEAFQTISTFFVHDLKNAASTLSLMLQNLPVHFDDPAFRQDALRGITKTVDRINQLTERLSVLRRKLELMPVEIDLNFLVNEALENLNSAPTVELVTKLDPLPKLVADREQLQSVITNLLLNARDAVETRGRITVETSQRGNWAALLISDTGCGMSPLFVRDSLFRPFQTTKKTGLGIGMFQSKMIVEAHRGSIQVKSEPGIGTSIQVMLPLKV